MALTKKGPEAVEAALAATLQLYLPAQLDALTALWADGTPLVHPKAYYAGFRKLVSNAAMPALIVTSLDGTQLSNGATSWGEVEHRLDVSVTLCGDNQHILDRQSKRFVEAIWEVLMANQRLDGSLGGLVGVAPRRYGRSGAYPQSERGKLLLQVAGWEVAVTMEDLV